MSKIALLFGLVALLVVTGCCSVTVPENRISTSTEREFVTALAADINEQSGSLDLSWKSRVDETFQALSDANVALFIWMKAAECESKRGNEGIAAALYAQAIELFKIATGKPGGVEAAGTPVWLREQWLDTLQEVL